MWKKLHYLFEGGLPLPGVDGLVKGEPGLRRKRSGDINGTVRNIHRQFHFLLLSDFVEDLVGRVQ